MLDKRTLTIQECAKFVGLCPMTVSKGLRSNTLPFGTAIRLQHKDKKDTFKYHIPTAKVEEYMGIKYEEFLKRKEAENND